MLRRIIETAGHDVVEADDGAAGIEKYFLENPDAVFLDLTMKDMYGLDVLAKLRELDSAARVVIASADIQDMTRTMVTEAGADGFINKPLSPEKVAEALDSMFGKGEAA
jgi:two-component system chemotaxis response regulator CheY